MSLSVNLRRLEAAEQVLEGELSPTELDIDTRDELVRVNEPLRYRIEVEKLDQSLLVRGNLKLTLDCECVRCLKPIKHTLEFADWTRHVPLQGEEAAPVVSDSVDLTPYIREDILLDLPQHPLCEQDCRGLEGRKKSKATAGRPVIDTSAWAELDKLKL
jgi:uncharacterized protein